MTVFQIKYDYFWIFERGTEKGNEKISRRHPSNLEKRIHLTLLLPTMVCKIIALLYRINFSMNICWTIFLTYKTYEIIQFLWQVRACQCVPNPWSLKRNTIFTGFMDCIYCRISALDFCFGVGYVCLWHNSRFCRRSCHGPIVEFRYLCLVRCWNMYKI